MNRTIEDIISERDDLIGDISKKDHNVSKSDNYSNIKNSILRSVIVNTPLSDAFFSDKNITKIQNNIRYSIFKQLNFKISNQSIHELLIIMRSVFLQNSKNLPNNIPKQISVLNNLVIKSIMPNLVSSVKQFDSYISDINTLPVPMEHPENIASAGTRTIDVTKIFYN
tara:strand:- start:20 stop:523 length:504 start_codon:yes stop_codon:yes gene_type:complete